MSADPPRRVTPGDGDPSGVNLADAFQVVAGNTPPTSGTDFDDHGHYGPGWLDKRCLLQDQVWVDIQGRPHRLTEMSREYRTNVLAYLRQRTPQWALDAYRLDVLLAVGGLIPPRQASFEIETLAALPTGWSDHTPLGLALHRLNGTTPNPLPTPLSPVAADESDHPQILRDCDTGTWAVAAHGSAYALDLQRRRLRRLPPSATEGHQRAARLASRSPWVRLDALVDCALDRALVALTTSERGRKGYSISTPIRDIART